MRRFTLLFDPDEEGVVREKILPRFEGLTARAVPFDAEAIPEQDDETVLVTYLDDAALALLVPQAVRRGWRLGLLPHPPAWDPAVPIRDRL